MHRLRLLLVLSISLIAAAAIAACGGSGGDEDPQEVLNATFQNDQTIESGNLDISVKVDAEGGENGGSFDASVSGPFQGGESGQFPQFDMTADVNLDSDAQDFSGSAGLTSTGQQAFVDFQDTDYEVPADVFSQFTAAYTQAQEQSKQQQQDNQNLMSSLGIDPTNWLTDLSNEGDEDVEGTETIHISGQADVPKMLDDVQTIVQKVPQASQQVTPQQLSQFDQLGQLIKSADFDIYTGKDDDILRKMEANLEIDPPDAPGSPDSVNVGFSVTLSDVNQPQTISAPSGAQPLDTLLQQFGVDPSQLGQFGSALDATGSAGGSSGGSGDAASSDAAQAYLECLGQAQGSAAIQQCEQLLK